MLYSRRHCACLGQHLVCEAQCSSLRGRLHDTACRSARHSTPAAHSTSACCMTSTPEARESTKVYPSSHLMVVSREQVTAMKGKRGKVVMPYTCRHMCRQRCWQPATQGGGQQHHCNACQHWLCPGKTCNFSASGEGSLSPNYSRPAVLTSAWWSRTTWRHSPLRTSHTRMVASQLPAEHAVL